MLNEIGWRAVQLDGGYRAWRRHVIAQLERLPSRFRFEVVCGLTGSGKSRLLDALAAEGAQVLDLERLARHRGSLLGDLPGEPQPSQKGFESQLAAALERFDPRRPVYVESESKRIGTIQVPDALLAAMRAAPCIRLDTPAPLRVALLKDEYAHYLDDAARARGAARASRPAARPQDRSSAGKRPPPPATGTRSSASSSRSTTIRPTRARSSATSRASATRWSSRRRGIDDAAFRALARTLDAAVRRAAAKCACDSRLTELRVRTFHYRLVNVFAEDVLAGNPLCVFEDARGLDDATMQALALQFNLSETTFVLPSAVATARVRIFTPTFEMPFAGHPTLGTAHVVRGLATAGDAVTLEMLAGVIPVTARRRSLDARRERAEASRGRRDARRARGDARASTPPTSRPIPQAPPLWVDTGSEQLVIPLASADAVRRAAPRADLLLAHGSNGQRAMAYVFAPDDATATDVVDAQL